LGLISKADLNKYFSKKVCIWCSKKAIAIKAAIYVTPGVLNLNVTL